MKPKKILLQSETRPVKRNSSQNRKRALQVTGHSKPSSRQRSEAVGLVLIGTGAFLFSTIYYVNTSKGVAILSSLSVNLGLGVYIIPGILCIWGIQRFLERPFENISSRISGCVFALLSGLALLGLDGGKVGTFVFSHIASYTGNIPAIILLSFIFSASLIFAFDILYKDLLKALLSTLGIFYKLIVTLWESVLTLLGLGIEAVFATIDATIPIIYSIITRIKAIHLSETHSTVVNLLTFNSGIFSADSSSATAIIGSASPNSDVLNPSHSISMPKVPQLSNKDEAEFPVYLKKSTNVSAEQPLSPPLPSKNAPTIVSGEDAEEAELVSVPAAGSVQIHIQDLSTGLCMPTPSAIPIATADKTSTPSNASLNDDKQAHIPNTSEPQAEQSQVSSTYEDSTNDLSISVVADESSALINSNEPLQNSDIPVSLDSHPIDKYLKAEPSSPRVHSSISHTDKIELPPLELLAVPPLRAPEPPADLVNRSEKLLKTLGEFNIKADILAVVEGPAVSRFELKPGPGVKTARILSLANDISLSLAAPIRIEAPIPGKSAIGIEIPNAKPTPVFFYDLVKNEKFRDNRAVLNLALGMTINNRPVFANLAEMPHLLIAGSTGSGKSVCINTIIASILFQARPDQVKLILIDPKRVELSSYNGIPHLMAPVVTDPKKASAALLWAIEEMMRRYELMETCGVRNITSYNEDLQRLRGNIDSSLEPMPYLVIIIDELADLMMTASAEVEGSICRLAQMARAVGIHLVIATQRPSVDVLTGIIKANLPTRIAFMVASQVDSRTILDGKGAECLLGKGDMLFAFKGQKPLRLQGAYISDRELQALADFVREQGMPHYVDITPTKAAEEDDDADESMNDQDTSDSDGALMAQIKAYLATQDKTSTSMLQRKFKIGYNRAARIMDILEEKGVVSPLDGSNKRRVLRKE